MDEDITRMKLREKDEDKDAPDTIRQNGRSLMTGMTFRAMDIEPRMDTPG